MKCFFCERDIHNRKYSIKLCVDVFLVCSECEHAFKFLRRQILYKRTAIIKKILEFAQYGDRDCRMCKFFNPTNIRRCRRDLSTYISDGRHHHSYAFFGCYNYTKIEKEG